VLVFEQTYLESLNMSILYADNTSFIYPLLTLIDFLNHLLVNCNIYHLIFKPTFVCSYVVDLTDTHRTSVTEKINVLP